MAFGISEFPHTQFYDSDLSELIRLYKQLVGDYDEIVEKLKQAQKEWQESIDYVEKWNQKWGRDFVELRKQFTDTTEQIKAIQQELIKRFEVERQGMAHYMNDILEQIKADNRKKKDEIGENIDKYITEFEEIQNNYRTSVREMLTAFEKEFEASLNLLDLNFKQDLSVFTDYVAHEVDTLVALIKAADASAGKFYDSTMERYENLLSQYDSKLKNAYNYFDSKLDEMVHEYGETSEEWEEKTNDIYEKLAELAERIEEVDKARVDIQAENVLIMSPVTHHVKRIQWVLDEMWFFFKAWELTAGEMADLGLTVEQFANWVCDKGLLPTHVGITALEMAAMGKWILLEKPDILAQLQGQIGEITYEALAENKEKITQEIIGTTSSYFSGILKDATLTIKDNGNFIIEKGE